MEPTTETKLESKSNLATPIAIIIAGVIIGGAMYFSDGQSTTKPAGTETGAQVSSLDNVRAVSDSDHIRGNPNAKIVIVEYSDTECPFCVNLHKTMIQVMEKYGKTGDVAWVYRHFPLDQLHPTARKEAVALECAGDLGGNDKFWEYTDRLYSITPANNGLNLDELPKIAEYVGLDIAKFTTCLSSGKHDERIEADVQNANATGGSGTPWSVAILKSSLSTPQNTTLTNYINQNGLQRNIIISPDKTKIALGGALPLVMFEMIIDTILK